MEPACEKKSSMSIAQKAFYNDWTKTEKQTSTLSNQRVLSELLHITHVPLELKLKAVLNKVFPA